MNREINFRAWDGKDLHPVWGLTPISVCYQEYNDLATPPPYYRRRNYVDGGVIEIMQYTGWKDKNGKEIWEDDIFRLKRRTFVIKWSFGCFVLRPLKPLTKKLDTFDPQLGEVIGNIYENPELMEAKQ